MTDIIKAVRTFTEAIGCTTDRYNVRQTALYIGLQLEEMKEKLEALDFGHVHHSGGFYTSLMASLHHASGQFKSGEMDIAVQDADREALLDADIDLAWVTIGSALSQGADVEGAAGEVTRANMDKLTVCHSFSCARGDRIDGKGQRANCNGTGLVAIKDENGKVKKPEGWRGPDISAFVRKDGATA